MRMSLKRMSLRVSLGITLGMALMKVTLRFFLTLFLRMTLGVGVEGWVRREGLRVMPEGRRVTVGSGKWTNRAKGTKGLGPSLLLHAVLQALTG